MNVIREVNLVQRIIKNLKTELPHDPTALLLGMYPEIIKTLI